MKICILVLMFLASLTEISAQELRQDSIPKTTPSTNDETDQKIKLLKPDSAKNEKAKFIPIPRKAALLSAVLPAGGQFYNRDYWKVPLVLSALAAGTWTAVYWRVRYNDFLAGYRSFYDLSNKTSATYGLLKADLNADSELPVFYRGGILNGERDEARLYNINQVKKIKDTYRRYFETSIVVTAAIYTLSIIEANVAAHLKTFDISDDITLRIEPKISQPLMSQPVPGVRLVFGLR